MSCVTCFLKLKLQLKMPMTFAFRNTTYAIWTYDPNEVLNFAMFVNITQLTITTEIPLNAQRPLTLPSLYMFPNLLKLSILNIRVTHITDLGLCTSLVLQCTDIASLSRVDTTRLTKLSIYTNNHLKLETIPSTVTDFSAVFQNFGDLRMPHCLSRLVLLNCAFAYLSGIPDSFEPDNLTIQDCRHNYGFTNITGVRKIRDMIHDANVSSKYTTYAMFGNLKEGLILNDRSAQSPITQALWLTSNYPRRMAEFLVDPTCI